MTGSRAPLQVLITIDTEFWPPSWTDYHSRFAHFYKDYMHGRSGQGRYALPGTVAILNEHRLRGVFFVEGLCAAEFGLAPLVEIVETVAPGSHEVQLHLHAEWEHHASRPTFPARAGYYLKDYSRAEQTALIARGLQHLRMAGVSNPNAFRAGNFACNADTLKAVAASGLTFDSSYNPTYLSDTAGIAPGVCLQQMAWLHGVYEVPVTCYYDRPGHLRHVQVTACSYREMVACLWQAYAAGWSTFVIVSHSFELMNRANFGGDRIVHSRFNRLCAFLDRHRDSFRVCGFQDLAVQPCVAQPAPLRSTLRRTLARYGVQALRKIAG